MKCKKCGAEIKEGQKFCQSCGQAINENGEKSVAKKAPKKEFDKKKIIKIAVPVAVIAVIVILLAVLLPKFGVGVKKIDFLDYVSIQVSGYNKYGDYDIYIDWDSINANVDEKKLEKCKKALMKYEDEYVRDKANSADSLSDFITVEITDNDPPALKNNDIIFCTFKTNKRLNEAGITLEVLGEALGVEFVNTQIRKSVSGLEDKNVIEAFPNIENAIVYSSDISSIDFPIAGHTYASVKFPESFKQEINGFTYKRAYSSDELDVFFEGERIGYISYDIDSVKKDAAGKDTEYIYNGGKVKVIAKTSVKLPDGYEWGTLETEYGVPKITDFLTQADKITDKEIKLMEKAIEKIMFSPTSFVKEYRICEFDIGTRKDGTEAKYPLFICSVIKCIYSAGDVDYDVIGFIPLLHPDGTITFEDVTGSTVSSSVQEAKDNIFSDDYSFKLLK